MKIGIITMHSARNYGAVLQTYALQNILENEGNEVEIINYRNDKQTILGYLFNINPKFQKNIFTKTVYLGKTIVPKVINTSLFFKFQKRKLHLSDKTIYSKNKIKDFVFADIYCVGSDQVWNPKLKGSFDSNYFFYGVKGKKISYSSSLGVYDLSKNEKKIIEDYLEDFSSISVRENSTLSLINIPSKKVECVLDPVFLLDEKKWTNFAECINLKQPYLLVYYFGNSKDIMEIASTVALEKNLIICRIAVDFKRYSSDSIIERFVSPERFVGLFLNASYVITNSFHGTAFSINFRKQLLIYPSTEHNARFDSIMQMFNLHERNLRKIESKSISSLADIDFDIINEILNYERKKSMKYLISAIT